MSTALSIAAGGIRTAGGQFETAARDIVRAGTSFQADPATATANPATSGGAPISVANYPIPDLADSLVDMKLAEISYKANIKVFEVAARLEEAALDILS